MRERTQVKKELEVLCIPSPDRVLGLNDYFPLLQRSLQATGVNYRGIGYCRLWFGKFDLIHLHFPEGIIGQRFLPMALFQAVIILGGLARARLLGRPIIWTAHNLKSHVGSRPKLEQIIWRAFSRLCCGIIFLSYASINLASKRYPWTRTKLNIVIPHGHYRDVVGPLVEKSIARKKFGYKPRGRVMTFFGNISPYKGVFELIDLFRETSDPDLMLVLVGRFAPDLSSKAKARLERVHNEDPRITTHFKEVSNSELADRLSASDLAILPYKDILNSGSAFFALSCDTPVCAPAIGSLPEMQRAVTDKWIHLYSQPLTSGDLYTAMEWAVGTRRDSRPPLDRFDWDLIAREHRHFFNENIERCRRRRSYWIKSLN